MTTRTNDTAQADAMTGHEHAMTGHQHGAMDATTHQRTFDGFVRFMTWNAVIAILVLIFLALANA